MEALIKPASIFPGSHPAPDRQPQAQVADRLITALEARVPGASGHSKRVARYATAVARRMDLPHEQVLRVRRAAILHDVGKLETPAAIVNKPGPLDEEEFAVLQRHAAIGARMVGGLGDDELAAIVRYHHERFDGRGYPDGLAGEEIPLGARVIAVADTFDAITTTRPYRSAKRHRAALELLDAEAGAQFDPGVVAAFRAYYTGARPLLVSLPGR